MALARAPSAWQAHLHRWGAGHREKSTSDSHHSGCDNRWRMAVRRRSRAGRKCHRPKRRSAFNLQSDLDLLESIIREIGDVVLVVVDPVSSYLGKTDSHKNAEVRG